MDSSTAVSSGPSFDELVLAAQLADEAQHSSERPARLWLQAAAAGAIVFLGAPVVAEGVSSVTSRPAGVEAGVAGVGGGNIDGARLTVSSRENVTGPAGSGSCGPMDQAEVTEHYKQNPEAPAMTEAELTSFTKNNEQQAAYIADDMEQDEGSLLKKILPAGQQQNQVYFEHMKARRIEKDVTVQNSYCDAQGKVVRWRVETLKAGTDVFAYVVEDGVFTRNDGTKVNVSDVDLAGSIIVNQNGETLIVELKNPCENELDRVARRGAEQAPAEQPEEEEEDEQEDTTTTTVPVSTTTSTTLPPSTTTTTSTTVPVSTTTSTTVPVSTTTSTTLPPSTTTTTSTTVPVSTTTSTTLPPSTTSTTLRQDEGERPGPGSTDTTVPPVEEEPTPDDDSDNPVGGAHPTTTTTAPRTPNVPSATTTTTVASGSGPADGEYDG